MACGKAEVGHPSGEQMCALRTIRGLAIRLDVLGPRRTRPWQDEMIPLLDHTASIVFKENLRIRMCDLVAVGMNMPNDGCSRFVLLKE